MKLLMIIEIITWKNILKFYEPETRRLILEIYKICYIILSVTSYIIFFQFYFGKTSSVHQQRLQLEGS